jgi:ectoine hydroxylase-related dioxygenase (phytanoyl-CoA dioxygenase family)
MARLTPDEIEHYRAHGYVVPRFRLPAARIDALRETLERLLRENPGVRPERLVSVHIEGRNAEGVRGSGAFLDLARDPALVELVADAIGPDVILWGCQLFCKPGGDGLEVPWHQDGHYWPIRPLATCTAWIALDASTRENGCLGVIPGSHRQRRLFEHLRDDDPRLVLNRRARDDAFDPAAAVYLELEPGEMSLHDVYMIHGSAPNRSPHRRAGVAIRYMPGTSVFERPKPSAENGYLVDFSTRPLWLLAGQDRTGQNDFTVGHRPG